MIKEPLKKMNAEELYIVMCEKADELQASHKEKPGDRMVLNTTDGKAYWLPTKEDYKQMTGGIPYTLFAGDVSQEYIHSFKSWRQLSLAYQMIQINKIWDGNNWVVYK